MLGWIYEYILAKVLAKGTWGAHISLSWPMCAGQLRLRTSVHMRPRDLLVWYLIFVIYCCA